MCLIIGKMQSSHHIIKYVDMVRSDFKMYYDMIKEINYTNISSLSF